MPSYVLKTHFIKQKYQILNFIYYEPAVVSNLILFLLFLYIKKKLKKLFLCVCCMCVYIYKRKREQKRRKREQTTYLEYLSILCIVSSAIQEIECPLEVHKPTN